MFTGLCSFPLTPVTTLSARLDPLWSLFRKQGSCFAS